MLVKQYFCVMFSIDVKSIYYAFISMVGTILSCEVCCVGDWHEIEMSGIVFLINVFS